MTTAVENKEVKTSPDHQKPHTAAVTDDRQNLNQLERRSHRPCESSAVFETWAQH